MIRTVFGYIDEPHAAEAIQGKEEVLQILVRV